MKRFSEFMLVFLDVKKSISRKIDEDNVKLSCMYHSLQQLTGDSEA